MTEAINRYRLRSDAPAAPEEPADQAPLVLEVAWEVCQQVGGIYTVIRTKAPAMVEHWRDSYVAVGPYNAASAASEFDEEAPSGALGRAVTALRQEGLDVHVGVWLISGRPRTILLNAASVMPRLAEIKYFIWRDHHISLPAGDKLVDQVVAFGYLVERLFAVLCEQNPQRRILGHFHEWMAAVAIPRLRHQRVPFTSVFTTHATMLGRYLAMNDPWFYDHLPFVKWEDEAKRFNIEAQVCLERAAAHGAHVFTTVSDITGYECEYLLGRKPDVLLPNGLNIEHFVALHEFQNLHRIYKEQIQQFVMAHFFPSYSFDLDKTLFFFTSGRYEYRNKGFDMTLDALSMLNHRLKAEKSDRTIIFFLISKKPARSINPGVLHSRAMLEEIRRTCQEITETLGHQLFETSAKGKLPDLNALMNESLRLRLRRMVQAWKRDYLPPIVTHDLPDDNTDEVLCRLRELHLFNFPDDPVKIVYHPDFVTTTTPLFGMDYDNFVRGCHLGVFPSAYEPWGYTPLECLARGIPAITSDLSGFGTYLLKHMPDYRRHGLLVVHRRYCDYPKAAGEMTDFMYDFCHKDRRERIQLRNRVESAADHFDWHNLGKYYFQAQEQALAQAE